MRLRIGMGGQAPLYIEIAKCRACGDFVSLAEQPNGQLDAHEHCTACQEPRDVPCTRCGEPWREDLVEHGLCEPCISDDEHAAELAAE
jgi:hypothetical protein